LTALPGADPRGYPGRVDHPWPSKALGPPCRAVGSGRILTSWSRCRRWPRRPGVAPTGKAGRKPPPRGQQPSAPGRAGTALPRPLVTAEGLIAV
jgi:hypothetical protein